MTRNQIEYLKHQEQARANRAQEALTTRRDEANISLNRVNVGETQRHNRSTEQIQSKYNDTYLEYLRQHQTGTREETQRHNLEVERQSLIDLGIRQQQADSGSLQAQAALTQAGAAYQQAATRQYEAENAARNQALQRSETYRHNVQQESLSRKSQDLQSRDIAVREGQLSLAQEMQPFLQSTESARAAQLAASASMTGTQESYLPEQNTRQWIGTVTGAVRDVTQAVGNVAHSYMDVMSGGLSGARAIDMMLP